jgi:uncharacterized repeat protein (TIGR02543 family)
MKKVHFLFTALIACVLFFAGCKKDEFVVTFNPNGGKGVIITQNFTQKVAQPLMANSFTNNGYTFTGWNTAANGTGASYNDQEIIQVSGHLVLYAQWRPVSGEFTVTFNANGATIGEMEPQKFEVGITQQLSANRFYRNDYDFAGWSTTTDGNGERFTNQQSISISSDMTLFAQWISPTVPLYHYVHFNANGGMGTMEPQEFIEGKYQKLIANTFTPADSVFIFTGWNTKGDGLGDKYSDMAEIRIYANMWLYAQWEHPDSITSRLPITPK